MTAARALRPIGYSGRVRLLPSPLRDRVDDAARVYGGLDPDRVLKGFREQAGLPAPGAPMEGWASRTTEATFGQWVSGIARLGAALDDEGLKARARELLDGWAATLPPDDDARMATYGWEKLACGLVDAERYAGWSGGADLVLRTMRTAVPRWGLARSPATPTDRDGRRPDGTLEWYTLAEQPYRAAGQSGAEQAAELDGLAALWHYDSYWDRFAEPPAPGEEWDVPVWRHAYSHVNTFASVAAWHDRTGDPRLLGILRTAHDWVTTTQAYPTGGYGPGEWSVPHDGSLGRATERRTDQAEITCGSWAAFKLACHLLEVTGEPRYADWIETLVHSGVGATVPVRPDGRTPYYADYRLGVSTKLPHWDAWPCCSGSYVQCVAHLHDLVLHEDDRGYSVVLAVPAEARLERDGVPVRIRQETAYPREETTRIAVTAERPVRFRLRVRVPSWSTGATVTVDGERLEHAGAPGGWVEVEREWEGTTRVVVGLGTVLRAVPVDRWHPHRVQLAFGPVVLAQESVFAAPLAAAPLEVQDLGALLERDDLPEPAARTAEFADGLLSFRPAWRGSAEQPVGRFRALNAIPERWPHRVSHDLDDPRVL